MKVNITTKDGGQIYPAKVGEYDWTAVAIGTNWEAGKKYVYTLNFTDGAGKVDPEKPDPTDPTDPSTRERISRAARSSLRSRWKNGQKPQWMSKCNFTTGIS